jgi:hypothetical protein
MNTQLPESARHCGYCGHPIREDSSSVPERFGERFCSEAHAEDFVAGVRAARLHAATGGASTPARTDLVTGNTCATAPAGPPTWRDFLKRAACWGAPVLLLVAIPLLWSGGWAAAGGSLLSALAVLACPLGMYVMMRGMMNMQQHGSPDSGRSKDDDGRA